MVTGNSRRKSVAARLISAALFVIAAGLGAPQIGYAQDTTTASSVTPENFAPPLQKLNGAIVFSGATGSQAPAGAEKIGITLSDVNLQGGLPQMAEANARLSEKLTNGRVAVSDLFNEVAALEEAYANAGYVLARIVLPQQSLRDGGVLRVAVVDGFVETVDTTAAPPEIQKRIDRLTAPLVNRKGITLRQLERQLLLAGDTAGVALGSALGQGNLPGGTVLTLEPEYKKITGFVGFDNNITDSLGNFNLSAGVEFNSPFGFGETFYARASGSPSDYFGSDPQYRVLAGGFILPIGGDGLALNGEITSSDTTPDDVLSPTRSNFDRQSLRLIYPFVRSRQVNVTTQFSIDRQHDSQDLIAGGGTTPIYDDKITALRLSGSLSYIHDDGAFSDVGAVLSRGVDALGARTLDDVGAGTPLSRQGADAKFTKLSLSGYHQRSLSDSIVLSITGRAQMSFGDPLLTSEQFGLSGARELSGFEPGELRGDSGWLIRAEVAHNTKTTFGETPVLLSPYAFVAVGGVSIEQPTVVERDNEGAHSFGVGLDLFSQTESRFRASSLRVEVARGERDNGSDNTRFSISGNFRF
ncbi:Polypeptide-transport-associated domain-containing protein [Sulfitobacter noctilucicola]|uniref:Hemolysin activation/secretion protein n=1 Tax=Sulfitobacter noctilucicola TaxID=1342301 RepID=A0A7W6M9W3_9RHOB|nr:ShlB/FhaC/HecB family hemolysin secretion/activation protein [Sulfitobacter noctilucicola]KIN63344.1 Polypeptide-transport-associated domain-containing protein [Sulfitobacter noctilucicola]MBB4175138.1 hemolysin activation/secretion protein [Sulfitobacter noctilucicola]